MYDIIFYKDRRGKEPVREIIEGLRARSATDKDSRIRFAKIMAYVGKLAEYGTRMGEPFIKHIEGDIWEIRPNRDRVFFFSMQGGSFVLLHHFMKKSQKTPRREIEQAKANMQDYLERMNEDEQQG